MRQGIMRIYWTFDAIPELAVFSKEERRAIWQWHYRRIWRSWRAWGALAIYFIVTSLVILIFAAGATLVPDYIIDPEDAPFIGAAVGTLPAVMIGGFISGILLCEIVRNEIRKTLSSGISPDVLAFWIGRMILWSWIGCGSGALGGGVAGAVVGTLAGFAEGGSSGALFGAGMGILTGGSCGCGVGGLRAGRKLPLGGCASAQFSIDLFAGASAAAWLTLVLALEVLVGVLMTR
jgi:hypothetical protein